ncbi:hypothetical protein M3J09_001047 [Ascochyta lentis]
MPVAFAKEYQPHCGKTLQPRLTRTAGIVMAIGVLRNAIDRVAAWNTHASAGPCFTFNNCQFVYSGYFLRL